MTITTIIGAVIGPRPLLALFAGAVKGAVKAFSAWLTATILFTVFVGLSPVFAVAAVKGRESRRRASDG